jgi:hypothetical protein
VEGLDIRPLELQARRERAQFLVVADLETEERFTGGEVALHGDDALAGLECEQLQSRRRAEAGTEIAEERRVLGHGRERGPAAAFPSRLLDLQEQLHGVGIVATVTDEKRLAEALFEPAAESVQLLALMPRHVIEIAARRAPFECRALVLGVGDESDVAVCKRLTREGGGSQEVEEEQAGAARAERRLDEFGEGGLVRNQGRSEEDVRVAPRAKGAEAPRAERQGARPPAALLCNEEGRPGVGDMRVRRQDEVRLEERIRLEGASGEIAPGGLVPRRHVVEGDQPRRHNARVRQMPKLVEVDPADFESHFAREPFLVTHRLAQHELLQLDSLAALAERLPAHRIEHNLGELPTVLEGEAPQADLTPAEIARTIDSNGCWMVLKNIELDADYKTLLDEALDGIMELVADREGGMRDREGFVFLSAPGSVTPSHIDPEHNFLLQVRGEKEMNVGRFPDARTEQLELERYYRGEHRNIPCLPEQASVFRLTPGDGIYVPVHAPHFVRNGERASVSLSVTFFTPETHRTAAVHSFNGKVRRLHLHPRPPGRRRVVDQLKAMTTRVARKAVHLLHARR